MAPEDLPPGGQFQHYLAYWAIWIVLLGCTVLFFRRTRRRTGRGRLVAGNALVFLCLAWTVVVAGETYLRYVYDATDSYGLTQTNTAWFRRHVRFNSQGFRDREFTTAARPGVERVVCVGDSFTFGYGVANPAHAWPQRLGAMLDARDPGRYDVRNDGVIGADTRAEAKLVEAIAANRSADRVLLGYCLNDTDDLLPPGRRFDRDTAPQMSFIAHEHSFLADFLWYRLRLRSDPRVRGYFDWVAESYDDPAVFGAQAATFQRIAQTCRSASMRLDVVVFPFFAGWGAGYPFDGSHERVVDAWRRLGVNAIDLRAAYAGIPGEDLVVNRFDAHPNERAHEIAARTILGNAFPVR